MPRPSPAGFADRIRWNQAYYRLAQASSLRYGTERPRISQGHHRGPHRSGYRARLDPDQGGADRTDHAPLAVGSLDWENQFVDRLWTYSLEAVWRGSRPCYAALAANVQQRYDVELTTVGALGVSAMMHGYLAFDADGELLTPFRTWRNTNTGAAAERLSAEFGHNIPHRWSVAHLYQAILNGEDHVGRVDHLTTLAGYVHWQLTGEKVLGIGDASGMFPIDIATGSYDAAMLDQFDRLAAEAGVALTWPTCCRRSGRRRAGRRAHRRRARLLDPTGRLRTGAPLCPPEGDAGTGMVATNSVAPRTGNVSAGTSIFAMVVLEHELSRVTASWTWSRPRPATWWRWCTATTAPASSTRGSVCSPSSPQALGTDATPRRSSRPCSPPPWTAHPTAAA